MEKKNVDNAVELVKQYEYQSMVFKKNKENLIREYNNQFKSYKEIKMENDNISRKIVSLQHLYEHEIKINEFYHEFADASKDTKDDGGIGLRNREINFSDENIDQFTKEQKLRMQINKNAAYIKRLEKQLSTLNSKLDEHKENLIVKYTNNLLGKK